MYVNGILITNITGVAGVFTNDAFAQDGGPAIVGMNLGVYGLTTTGRDFQGYLDDAAIWSDAKSAEQIALIHGLGSLAGVALGDSAIDNIQALFDTAGAGIVSAGGTGWKYATGLGSTTVGTTGGSVGTADAFIVLAPDGRGIQQVPEPATLVMFGMGGLIVTMLRRARGNKQPKDT
jgi:hypothetical protein